MTTTVDLLRHGETEGRLRFCGSTDHPLTEQGWQQMWRATTSEAAPWQHIVTSPLRRCATFAEALGQSHTIPVAHDTRLQEIHFGAWENQSAASLMETQADALTRFWQNPVDFSPPQSEYLLDFQTRVLAAWHEITARFTGQHILLITHGGVIRIIRCHLEHHPLVRLLELNVRHAQLFRVRIEPSATTVDSLS